MPECPYCLKQFDTPLGVTRHLSQPTRRCRFWQDDLVPVSEVLSRGQNTPPRSPEPLPALPESPMHIDAPMDDWDYLPGANDDGSQEDQPQTTDDVPMMDLEEQESYSVTKFEGAARIIDDGDLFLDRFNMDTYSFQRKQNIYYPFATEKEWKLAKFLLCSSLSMAQIDEFLSLEMTKDLNLSFRTAKELRGRAELLPSGPRWKYRLMSTEQPTASPTYLYYRDTLDCVELLFNHPYFQDKMDFVPQRVYKTVEGVIERVYSEWLTGDAAWRMQSALPAGSTLLGVILSSDKTNITSMTGGRVAHPLLISLANIQMRHRNKASNHAFLLAALLPVSEFMHSNPRIRTVLADRLVHNCLDIVLEPLKQAAILGRMMSDPAGNSRLCYTPLASYIADIPEAGMLSGVRGLTSHVTMAMYKDFGDPFRHPSRLGETTLRQLASIVVDPDADFEAFFNACGEFRLNGVLYLFWRNWALSEPSIFFTPEPLHYWFREFYDHDFGWCLLVVGPAEMDFRYSVLTPIVGLRHFTKGVSKLKQVTGRVQRDLQRYIVAVIVGAAPSRFVRAIRALIEFRYLSQARVILESGRKKIADALQEFHDNKDIVMDLRARRGKKGKVIKHWRIPKLELMQSVVPSIAEVGSPLQWSADTTEHAHIKLIKDPARASNKKDYDSQICRYLDRHEKCRLFDDAITLLAGSSSDVDTEVESEDLQELDQDIGDERESSLSSAVLSDIWGPNRQSTNYFEKAKHDLRADTTRNWPSRSFVKCSTAIHLNRDPSCTKISIDEAEMLFSLPNLRATLTEYFDQEDLHFRRDVQAGRALPFDGLQLWFKVRLQQKCFHDASIICPTFTVNASPPDGPWKYGRYDAAVFTMDESHTWPESGLTGHIVAQVRMILRPIPPRGTQPAWAARYLTYVQSFDIQSNGAADPVTHMRTLKRQRSGGTVKGHILPLDYIRSYAHIVPKFGAKADPRLTCFNSLHFADTFYLNHYFDKDFFYAVST